MASNGEPEDLTKRKYYKEDPEITPETITVFKEYVGIKDEDEIVRHIKDVRAKAWSLFPYPCIGLYSFLTFGVSNLPPSEEVLRRLKGGQETLLDLGCCFGQDIRTLVHSGVPSENLAGFDLRPEFIEFGYDLFRDKETLKSKFRTGDFFESTSLPEASFDFIHAGAFFHLFDWDDTVVAVSKAVRLLKPKKGSMMLGWQTGVPVADIYEHETTRTGRMYRHSRESFKTMVAEVSEKTGIKLEVEVPPLKEIKDEGLRSQGFKTMNFAIRVY